MFLQSQKQAVSVAHRYWNNLWSQSRNRDVYGENASAVGIGSNLVFELGVWSKHPDDFDFAPALAFLKQQCDHKCFFTDIPEFSNQPSTLERITKYLAQKIFARPAEKADWAYLRVWENDRLACRQWRDQDGLELTMKCSNLWITCQTEIDPESGLAATERALLPKVVRKMLSEEPIPAPPELWSADLWQRMKSEVPTLKKLHIDAFSHSFITVNSNS